MLTYATEMTASIETFIDKVRDAFAAVSLGHSRALPRR
jgi:hypothetical protein